MFQDSGGDTMLVPVGINGTRISAVVDTVVQVTVMNPETCQTLGLVESSSSEVVQLRNAQKESVMSGHLWKHVGLRLGGRKYYLDIVEADINDSFILGMDFLQQHHCKIDLGQNVLKMGDGEKIYSTMRGRKKTGCYNVSRVTLEKKAKIPPSSIKICLAKMNNPADVPFLLEGEIHDDVYVLPLLIQGSDFVNVCVVNLSDVPVCLRRHTLLAKAVEVDAMLDPHGAESGDGAQGPVVYVRGDDFDGHIDAELPSICRVESTEDGSEVQFFSAESQDGSLDTSVDVKVRPSRDSVSSDGSSLEGTCSHVTAGLPTPNGAEGRSLLPDEAKANDTQTRRLPAHLQSMYDDAATRLSKEQAARLHELLLDFADVFAAHDLDIGEFTTLVHWIKTGMAFPILQQMRRTPLGFEGEEKKHLEAMLAAKVIEPSVSEWASPPVLVRKHDKSWRYCIDFRALNSVTERDAYPLPLIEECIDSLDGMRWFCTLDMNSGYWQIPIAEEDKKKTAFLTRYGLFQFLRMRWFCTLDMNLGYWQIPIAEEDKKKTAFLTRYGLFQFLRMPFGLSNAPATFQRAMHLVLAGLIWESVIVYLDDINVMGKTFDQTLANLEIVLKRFRKLGLKLKPRKCALFCTEIKFLGRKIDANGVHVTADHIQTVLDWPKPKNRKELESFLGFVNYHREFMCGLAEKSSVLYQLTGANSEWVWDEQHTEAFKLLKKAVTELPVLGFPNSRDQFILDTDASDVAIGAELSQVQEGRERTIAFTSKSLNQAQRSYCTTRKELLAVVVFTNHFCHYLLGPAFTILTDHASLVWLMRFKQIGGQLSRWLETLSQFAYIIEHRSGKKHCNAEGFSRIPERATCDCYIAGQDLNSLPCGGCTVCTKMHDQWKRFERDVDDVLPLAIHHVQREEFNPMGEGSSVARSKQTGQDKGGFHLLGEGPSSSASPLGSSEIEGDFISDTEFGPAVGSGSESADGTPLLSGRQQWGPVWIKFHGAVFQRGVA